MKNYLPIITLAAIATLFTSCSIYTGSFSAVTYVPGTYIEGKAFGKASASYFFQIGGLNSDGLVDEARSNLLINYPLKKGQFLSNYALDIKTSYYLIYTKQTVKLTAEIGHDDLATRPLYADSYFQFQDTAIANRYSYLHLNDTVMLADSPFDKVIILQLSDCSAIVKRISDKVKINTELDKLLVEKNTIPILLANNIKIGDKVKTIGHDEQSRRMIPVDGKLIAASRKYALASSPSNIVANGKTIVKIEDIIRLSKK